MPKKILLVEDNEGDQFLIREALEISKIEHELIVVESGEDGVKKAESENPDIAILDTRLPGMDGFQTCKKIKESCGDSVKIIIMTGVIDAVDAVKAREMGADEYAVKTMSLSELIRTIERLIK